MSTSTAVPQEQHPALITLINGTYTDQVDRILSAQANDDSIIAIAQDGKKQLAIKITEAKIKIRILNPEVIKGAANFAEDDEPDPIEPWMTELRQAAGELTDRWVGQVKDLLDESGDLASFSERLLTVYPDLDGDRLRSIMADAMTAASIAGSQEDEI